MCNFLLLLYKPCNLGFLLDNAVQISNNFNAMLSASASASVNCSHLFFSCRDSLAAKDSMIRLANIEAA